MYSADLPFWAPVASACYLTASMSERKVCTAGLSPYCCSMDLELVGSSHICFTARTLLQKLFFVGCAVQVLHLALSIAGSGMPYAPGDSIGVAPHNSADLVQELLQRLSLDGDRVFSVAALQDGGTGQGLGPGKGRLLPHLPCPCTVRRAFLVCSTSSSPVLPHLASWHSALLANGFSGARSCDDSWIRWARLGWTLRDYRASHFCACWQSIARTGLSACACCCSAAAVSQTTCFTVSMCCCVACNRGKAGYLLN